MTPQLLDLPDETREMMERFNDYAGTNGPLEDAFEDNRGYIVDRANILALVYDEDKTHDGGDGLPMPQLTEPASGVTERNKRPDGYHYAHFTFPAGNEGAINIDLVEKIDEIYGTDLIHQPQRVKSHPDQDTWPIRVDDTESGTSLLAAPLVVDLP